MNKKLRLLIIAPLIISCLSIIILPNQASAASGAIGTGSDLGGGTLVSGSGASITDGFSWVHYTYTGANALKGREIRFQPGGALYGYDDKEISGECTKTGGFWHFGYNTTGAQDYLSAGYTVWGDYWGSKYGYDHDEFYSPPAKWWDKNGDWGHSYYTTAGGDHGHFATIKNKFANGSLKAPSGTLNHTLYIDNIDMYKADSYSTDASYIRSEYDKAARMLGYTEPFGEVGYFCALDNGVATTFQGHTTIKVDGNAQTIKSGWDKFNSGTYTTDSDSVDLAFTHKLKRTDNENVATSVQWKLATADDGLSSRAIGTNNNRTLEFSASERNGATKTAETTTYTVKLDPGTTKTICQGINHELTVEVGTDGARISSQSGPRGSAKACITIKRKGIDVQNPSSAKTETSYIGEQSNLTKTGAHTIYFYVSNSVARPNDSQVKGGATKDYGEGEGSTPGADDSASANSAICNNFNSLCRTYAEASSNNIIIPDDANLVGAKVCAASSSKNSVFKETRTRTKNITYVDSDGNTVEETITEEYDVYTYYWKFSDLSCSPIAKKPNFQVTGGAAYTAGKINTSKSSKVASGPSQNKTYGSWSEYLAIAGDTIKNFGSGATLRTGSDNTSLSKNSPLTIANDSSRLGRSGIDSSSSTNFINALKTRFIDSDKYNHDLVNVIYRDGSYDLNLADLAAGKHNIIYAKNINISGNITEINAWLIAENTINTCSSFTAISVLSADVCNQPLTINGIAYAKNFKLYRTAGALAGDNSANPAEIFNLTAGDYRRAYNYASTTYMQPSAVYTQELAPRI